MKKWIGKLIQVIEPILEFLYTLPIIGYYIDLISLFITASFCRFGSGHHVATEISKCRRPQKLLKLYEYEGCPFCRKVRETLCVLDLDVIIYPCPRETFKESGYANESRYRAEAKRIGGKCQFPLLVDENVSNEIVSGDDDTKAKVIYDSDKIIEYLWSRYGNKADRIPTYILGSTTLSFYFLYFASILRCFPQHGLIRIPSKKPQQLLELWQFEPSPFCKKVREILCCLEIAYISRNVPRGSLGRNTFKQKYGDRISDYRKKLGLIQVPMLVDPNTKTEMLESEDIKKYLIETYQDGEFKANMSLSQYFIPASDDKKKD